MLDESKQDTITAPEFARRTGHHLSYVYSLLTTGKLHAEKINGEWAIAASEVERRAHRHESAASAQVAV
jgi:hypothetical protein